MESYLLSLLALTSSFWQYYGVCHIAHFANAIAGKGIQS